MLVQFCPTELEYTKNATQWGDPNGREGETDPSWPICGREIWSRKQKMDRECIMSCPLRAYMVANMDWSSSSTHPYWPVCTLRPRHHYVHHQRGIDSTPSVIYVGINAHSYCLLKFGQTPLLGITKAIVTQQKPRNARKTLTVGGKAKYDHEASLSLGRPCLPLSPPSRSRLPPPSPPCLIASPSLRHRVSTTDHASKNVTDRSDST
jgi:hypothetical protein